MDDDCDSRVDEFTHVVFTIWEWGENQLEELENSWK